MEKGSDPLRAYIAAGLLALALIFVWAGCGQPAAPLSASLVPPAEVSTPAKRFITITGFSSKELSALGSASVSAAEWLALMPVTVDGAADGNPPVAGQYRVTATGVDFIPTFPFDPGRGYWITVDPSKLPTFAKASADRPAGPVFRTIVVNPKAPKSEPTTVSRMLPTSTVLPENLLRIYLEFSAPMAREHGRDFLKLVDDRGAEVKNAFLALDVDFWSPDGRRYTVFLDPGRVKRGILPNDQFGRALTPGRRFALVVDPKWRDEHGQPLAAPFRHEFSVGPADMNPIRPSDWKIAPARAGSVDPLIVTFAKPLDHGLLNRALGVERGGTRVDGAISVGANETTWRFTPATAWTSGSYDLVVLSILEDPMGNKIGRAFDVDKFTEIDKSPTPERTTVPFVVR